MFEKLLQKIRKKVPGISEISTRNVQVLAVAVIAVFSLLTLVGTFEVLGIKTQYSLRQFFPKYHPLLRQDEVVNEKFHLSEHSPFLIVAKLPTEGIKSTWANKDYLDSVKKLSATIKTFPKVLDAQSISTLQSAVQSNGELGVGAMVDYLTPEKLMREIKRNPILSPLFVSRDAHTLTIFVSIDDASTVETEVLKEQLIKASKENLPFAEISVGGVPAIQSDMHEMLGQEIGRFIAIAVVMSILALSLIFKNIYPVIICTLTALMTNVMSVWGISIFGFSFSVLSSTIPILVTMTVISISIHSILRVIESDQLSSGVYPFYFVVLKTFKDIFRPNLLSALTTSVGFFTLTLSESPIIKEFGLSVGIALLVTWLNTAILLPAFLVWAPKPILRPYMSAKARWPFYVLRYHRTILASVILLSLFGAWKGQNLSWKARLFDDLPSGHIVRVTTELVDKSLGGLVPLDVEIKFANGENPWMKDGELKSLDDLAKGIREKNGVGSILTLNDVVKSSGLTTGPHKVALSEMAFLMSMSGDSPLKQFVSSDGLSTRLAIRLRDIPGSMMWNLVQEIRKDTKNQFPNAKIRMAGTAAYVHDINNALSKDLLYGFWQAMGVIFILLVLSYRSFAWAILACLPNLTPPCLLLGALSLWQVPIKPGIAIVLSISLGLAFNNTVYLLERMRHMIEKGHSYQKSLDHTFWSEANPCFFSSMVLIVGFAGFAVSYFKMNQLFGIFMVLSVLTGLLGDLIMLPALIQFILQTGSRFLKAPVKMVKSAFILGLVIGATHQAKANPQTPAAATTTENRLNKLGEKMASLVSTKDEVGKISMKIIEPNGTNVIKEIAYSRLNETKAHYTIMRMISPKDIKGTALLSVIKGETEEKWIYLPSSKQTRKIATSDSNSRILDSELYSEDFDIANIKGLQSAIVKEEPDGTLQIETKIASAKSSYSKSVSWVGKDSLVKKTEVYDKKGALLKLVEFPSYIDVGNGKKRASQINITNLQNKRKTELTLTSVKVDQNLKERDFSTRALAENF